MIKFPYKANDVLGFPDTETETVDVGIGYVAVAQTEYEQLVRVVKKGKGVTLQLVEVNKYRYSEAFDVSRKKTNSGYISLKEYINYFGNYNDLKFVCTWEEYNCNE